jgi:hypothetical protein
MPDDYDRADYLTPAQVAVIWGVTPDAVRHACRSGRIRGALRTPTGRWLVPKRSARLLSAADLATGGTDSTSEK